MDLVSLFSQHILMSILVVINIISFFIMVHDKSKAARGNTLSRTSEGLMFFMATIFGGIGIYLGMILFRHKTRKWYFQIGIPLLILQNLAIVYLIRELFIAH